MTRIHRRHLATLVGVGLVTLVGWLAIAAGSSRSSAPDVNYTLLDGSVLSTGGLQGQVVLINFWATTCSACVAEMAEIAATDAKFRARGYRTVAVAMAYDPPAYVAEFAERSKLPFSVAIDNTGEIVQRFGGVRITPTTLLINKRGEIVKRYVGAPDFSALHALIEQLLAEA
jgi:peroxiredoxin